MVIGNGLVGRIGAGSNRGWVCCGIGVVLAGCVAIANASANAAQPVSGLVAAFTKIDGDRDTIEMSAEADGRTKVVLRGDYFDGRPLLGAFFAALTANDPTISAFDVDVDVKVATLAGFGGEALHDVVLRIAGKGGELTEFALAGKLGVAELRGELRTGREGRREMYFATGDAGALFRLVNLYRRVEGGQAWIAMDLPSANQAVENGVLDVHDFKIRDEQLLQPLAIGAKAKRGPNEIQAVSHLRFDFKLSADQLSVSEGVVVGPLIGATTGGKINFAEDDVKLRGTMIPRFASDQATPPPYSLHPLEGMFTLSYRIEGRTGAPVLRIDPFGPLAPGLLRKLFVPDSDGK